MIQCLIEQMCTSLTKVAKTTKNKLCHKQFILDWTLQGAHTHDPPSWSVVSRLLLGKMSFYRSVSEANVADNRVSRESRQEAKTSQSSDNAGFLFRLEESEYIWLTTHKNKQLEGSL